jgi:hypothetical protein
MATRRAALRSRQSDRIEMLFGAVRCRLWYLADKPERLAFVRYPTRADVLASIGFTISVVVKARSEQPDAWLCSFDLHQAGVLFQINAHSDLGDLIKNSFAIGAGHE